MQLRTIFRYSDTRILLTGLILIIIYIYDKLNLNNIPELVAVLIAVYVLASFIVIISRKFRRIYKTTAVAFDMGGVLTRGEYFTEELEEIPEMKGLMRELKKYHLVAICSNNNWEGYLAHEKKYGWDEIFDAEVLSGKYGIQKPNKKIYQILLKELGVKPKNCVFVDDKIENIEAAESLGIKGIHFTSYKALVQELKRLKYL